MNELSKLADHDSRERDRRTGEYTIPSVIGGGRIVCYRDGIKIGDFYRTSGVLLCESKKETFIEHPTTPKPL